MALGANILDAKLVVGWASEAYRGGLVTYAFYVAPVGPGTALTRPDPVDGCTNTVEAKLICAQIAVSIDGGVYSAGLS